jgi:hypothetical protein
MPVCTSSTCSWSMSVCSVQRGRQGLPLTATTSPHEESTKDATVQVPLLGLANERVLHDSTPGKPCHISYVLGAQQAATCTDMLHLTPTTEAVSC